MTESMRRWPPLAAATGLLLLYASGALHLLGDRHSGWQLLLLLAQAAAFLLFGGLLWQQVAKLQRAQKSLLAANAELQAAEASLQTSNSARRATQAALRRSEQRFRMVFDNMRNIIVCMGTKGADEFGYDREGAQLLGADVERIAGTRKTTGRADIARWYEAVHPDDRAAYAEAERRRKNAGEPYRITYRFIHPDSGDLKWAMETGWTTRDPHSGDIFFDSYILDITEQKRLEQVLLERESEVVRARQRLVDGIEGLTDGLALYDADDRLIICNQGYRDLFGLSPDLLSPGTRFEGILRAHVEAGRVAAAVGREEEWIAERLAQHRDPHGLFERCIDGRWYQFSDRPTSSGGTVTIFTRIDELKQREARLRESQAMLLSVINNVPLTVSITDRERRIVLLNKAIEDLYGVRLVDVVGRGVDEFRPARYRTDTAARDHYRVVETGEPIRSQTDYYGSEGGQEAWITNLVPIRDDEGTVRYVLRTTMEIPQLARANQALAESRALLMEAHRRAKLAYWSWKAGDGPINTWSEGAAEVLGIAPDPAPGDDDAYRALIHAEDRQAAAKAHRDLYYAGRPFAIDYRIRRRDGSLGWIRETGDVELDAQGIPLRQHGTIQDITDQKQGEMALRDSEARLRAFMDNAPVGMMVKDQTGLVLAINRLGAAYHGRRTEDIVGLRTHDFMSGGGAAVVAAHEQTVMKKGIAVERELHFPDRSDLEWTHEVKFPIRDADGEMMGLGAIVMDISDRKRAEAARQQSDMLLRGFMDNSPVAISINSPDGRFLVMNRWVSEILGLPADRIVGRTAPELVDSENTRLLREMEIEVLRTGNTVEQEIRFSDQPRFGWIQSVRFPIRDSSGAIAAIGNVSIDITDRKRAEFALRKSEARLIEAQRRAKLAYWSWHPDTDTHEWSPQAAAILGRPGATLPSHDEDYLAFLHPEDRDRIERAYVRYLKRPEPYSVDYRVLRADGTVVWIRELAEPEIDSDGLVGRCVGTIQDVTDQKLAEEALRGSEARLRGFMDHAPLLMYLKGPDGRYQLVNREFERVEGKAAERVCGRTAADLYPPDLAELFQNEDREVVATGAPLTREYTETRFGQDRHYMVVKFPIRDESGAIVGIGGFNRDISERRAAVQALRESEVRMRAILDHAPMIMHLKGLDGRFELVNREFERVEGRTAASIRGLTVFDLLPREAAEAVTASDREVLEQGRVVVHEYSVPEREIYRDRMTVKFPIRDDDNIVVGIGAFTQDVTQRKAQERALRDSEARLRLAQRRARLAYYTFPDAPGRSRFAWSAEASVVLGIADERLPTDFGGFIALVHPEDRPRIRAYYDQPWLSDHEESADYRVLAEDGSVRWIRELSSVDKDEAGRTIVPIGTIQDITNQKRAEEAVQQSEAQLRRAQQQARLSYWRWEFGTDGGAEEFRWSPGSGLLLGTTDADMPTTTAGARTVTHPDDAPRMRRLYEDVRAGRDEYAAEYRLRRRDGRMVWVREVGEIIRDADGRRIAVEGTLQDITEQHELQEQLQQAQKIEALGQLTGGIAHDFNNLLAIVLGNLELLQETGGLTEPCAQKVRSAVRATLRGADLTQRLLAFARRQPLAPRLTQVNDLIREMKDLLTRPLGPMIGMELALAGDLGLAEIDPAQLETSLLNMTVNARDAMPEGGKLTIATANVQIDKEDIEGGADAASGDYVEISVSDTGLGMTPEVKLRAFDPFFTTKGVGQGTGLGLSMVYGFVRQSGGHITLDSEPGRGTTVRLYLPRAAAGTPS